MAASNPLKKLPNQMPAKPKLPWALAVIMVALIGGSVFAAEFLMAPPASQYCAIGGALLGIFGTMFGNLGRTLAGGALGIALVWANHAFGSPVDPRLAVLALAAAAAIEDAKFGGRSFTIAIIGAAMLSRAAGMTPLEWQGIAVFSGAMLLCGSVITAMTLAGRAARPPAGWSLGLRQGLFLALGLSLAITVAEWIGTAQAFWVITMVVFRALGPADQPATGHITFAIGTIAGAAMADAAIFALGYVPEHLRQTVTTLLATAATLIGMRNLPAQNLYVPMGMSVGVILAVAPSFETAFLRGETALAAAIIAILLSGVLDLVFRLLEKTRKVTPV